MYCREKQILKFLAVVAVVVVGGGNGNITHNNKHNKYHIMDYMSNLEHFARF
jgi:hypothetical protein